LLVSQPDLAKELGVQSPTVRRWCQTLGLEPACKLGSNYYTLAQADLIRRYGSAGTTGRREILEELKDRPFQDRASDCTVCGAWNPPGSQHCGECGAALGSAEA
jgi:ribosomal protein L40E